jgi:hypothetical protein
MKMVAAAVRLLGAATLPVDKRIAERGAGFPVFFLVVVFLAAVFFFFLLIVSPLLGL